MPKIKIICGLGNIGKGYEQNRHNVGKWFISEIAKNKNNTLKLDSKFNSDTAKVTILDSNILLVFPRTYMNNSGLAVYKIINFYKINHNEIFVIHDELDIDCGSVRLKKGGHHGGHNGIKSINQYLGTNDYLRLRIGIGHPGHKSKVSRYVLSNPSIQQKTLIYRVINNVICVLDDIIKYNLESVMQKIHRK